MINNTILIIIIVSFFLHIVDDFYLQGILASMKQKEWWEEHANDVLYKYDFIVALLIHGLSWSFMVHLPTLVYLYLGGRDLNCFCISLLLHAVMHAIIDDAKANARSINLVTDQVLHIFQITVILITNLI